MNYNNSASRICLPRPVSPAPMKAAPKPVRKPFRKTHRQRVAQAAVVLFLAFAAPDDLHAQVEDSPAPPVHTSLLSLAAPCAGLVVALWRARLLWRDDLVC